MEQKNDRFRRRISFVENGRFLSDHVPKAAFDFLDPFNGLSKLSLSLTDFRLHQQIGKKVIEEIIGEAEKIADIQICTLIQIGKFLLKAA